VLTGFLLLGVYVCENEFEAYYYESKNECISLDLPLQSFEYGWTPIRYLEGASNAADLINKHSKEILEMLSRVPPAAAANIKKEIKLKTGVNL
jgi:hypothetical protein